MQKILLVAFVLFSVANASSQAGCDCRSELKYLIKKVETNYPGYHIEMNKKNEKQYARLKAILEREAEGTTYDDCYFILKRFTDHFSDGHLSVLEFPSASQEIIDSLKRTRPVIDMSEEEFKRYFTRSHLYPIEGIWKSNRYTIAIKRTSDNTFIGSVLRSENRNWTPGQVKLEIYRKSDHEYTAVSYNGNHLRTHTQLSIWRSVLMNEGATKWVRIFPASPDLDLVNLRDPALPVLKALDKENVLLTLPSFIIEKRYLDSLVQQHDAVIRTAKNLIIDLRSNSGGNMVYQSLWKYTYTQPMRQFGSRSLATDDNIAYFTTMVENAQKNGGSNEWAKGIQIKLSTNKGQGVEVIAPDSLIFDTVLAFPITIAVITDRSNASSAEAFLKYYIKQSSKFIQFGDRTAGVLDYGSTNAIPLSCPSGKFYLSYPVFFENNLPEAGINRTGLVPDVNIPSTVENQIKFVIEHLKRNDL